VVPQFVKLKNSVADLSFLPTRVRHPAQRYPEPVNDDLKLMENSFDLPDEALLDQHESVSTTRARNS
jgi:hypothetical protein